MSDITWISEVSKSKCTFLTKRWISDIMDPPFRPSHIDGGALHLHRRCSNNRGPQTRGSSSLCVKRNPFSHLTICEIADSRYQSIYNPTTDEWILQVLKIPTVLITFLINYEILLKQFISPKSINSNETFFVPDQIPAKAGQWDVWVSGTHSTNIISKYWNWVEFKHFQWLV